MKKALIVVAAVLVVLCGVGVLITAVAGTQHGADVVVNGGEVPGPSEREATPIDPTVPKTSILKDGVFLVGSDVLPGQYRTTVPSGSIGCYWARLKGTSGDFDEIITNGTHAANAQVTVTIKPTDYAFETSRCGSWMKIA